MNLLELREQRVKLLADARKILDKVQEEQRELSGDETQKFDAMTADADKLQKQIELRERQDKLEHSEAELRHVSERKAKANYNSHNDKPTAYEFREAFRDWALAGTGKGRKDSDALYRASRCGLDLSSPNIDLRALAKGSASTGGDATPVNMMALIEKKLAFFNPLRDVVTVFQTTDGNDFDHPRTDDTSNSAVILDEAGTILTDADPSFDKVTFKAWKYVSKTVKVSLELLQDSIVDVPNLLAEILAERFGRAEADHFITGDGTTEPQGLATGASVGVNLASGNALTYDKILDLVASVDVAYRNSPSAAFVAHDATIMAVRKLKDDNNNYLWQPSLQLGAPDRLAGYAMLPNNYLTSFSSPGDNQKLILFGDLSRYKVRDVAGATLYRLNELYAATGEVGFGMIKRTDARYVGHSGCVKSLNSYDSP